MSKFEQQLIELFRLNSIPFIQEKTYSDLHDGKYRYDFYLPSMNILIECDGAQHFQRIPKFHKTLQDFHHYQEADRRKNSYALAHNIRLYRIPYWKQNTIQKISDIFNPDFIVSSKWHNDQIYKEYIKSIKS